jgi:hypothetical protein
MSYEGIMHGCEFVIDVVEDGNVSDFNLAVAFERVTKAALAISERVSPKENKIGF